MKSNAVESPSFAAGACIFLETMHAALEKKVLGSEWPVSPPLLGKALSERAMAGEFQQIGF